MESPLLCFAIPSHLCYSILDSLSFPVLQYVSTDTKTKGSHNVSYMLSFSESYLFGLQQILSVDIDILESVLMKYMNIIDCW